MLRAAHLLGKHRLAACVRHCCQQHHEPVLLFAAGDARQAAPKEALPVLQEVEVAQQPAPRVASQLQQAHRGHLLLAFVNHDEAVLEVAAAGCLGLRRGWVPISCLPQVAPTGPCIILHRPPAGPSSALHHLAPPPTGHSSAAPCWHDLTPFCASRRNASTTSVVSELQIISATGTPRP